ncbi:uncharacterized protein LOC120005780 isoform X2 [Tripterygium wilfordii]|uniref:uncharacterized protein LOC120005780 isoform X2 n=1 Tax=Tripterygium wilfordii TaxID=458696 RepID=UPI0018F7E7E0|nr:uncharacterized protein LOC120005780 isoform X2 [Tripterygium wilfordii]
MNRCILLTNRLSTHKLATGCNGITKRRTRFLLPCQRSSRFVRRSRSALVRKTRRITNKKLAAKIRAGIKRLRGEMAEISDEQKSIREGQRQVREKFEKIKAEREQLWKETELIAKQNAAIQVRLGLMSGIVKARAQKDFDLAAQLTRSLRDLVAPQNEEIH